MKSLTKETFKIYWQHSKKHKLAILFIVLGTLGISAVEVYTPFLYKNLFNILAYANSNKASELTQIIIYLAIASTIGWFFRRGIEFANVQFQARTMSDILNTCFDYLHGHSFGFFTNNFVGSLVRKVNRYTRAFEDIADELIYRVGRTALIISSILVVLFLRNKILGLSLLIWTAVFVGLNIWFAKYKIKYDIYRASVDTKTTGRLADTVTNNINLKLFGAKDSEYKAYQDLTEELYQARKFTWNLNNYVDSAQSALLYGLEIGLMYIAVRLWLKGLLTIGDFALIQGYLIQIIMRVWDVGRFMRRVYESLADANEMTEILTTPHEIQDSADAFSLAVRQGAIEFKNVCFHYHEKAGVLNKFNLKINAGERVALIGPSGGGKTTIVKLLFRFYDIQKGEILIDGQNIAKATQKSLHESLALVPQEPILFHRSLIENIRYARPTAGKNEIIKAAKLAHAHEFITSFPQGYETFVGERGVKLSGGERQRVAIARAILKNAPVLVLDEATSSLDSESEKLIQDALKNLMKDKTVIVIAHRLSTIMQMDRIIVLENGEITEEGKHEELLKAKQGTYQKLWHIQAGGFTA